MRKLWERHGYLAALLLVSAGVSWSYVQVHNLVLFWQQNIDRFQTFFSLQAGKPEQYRFLQYWLAHGFGLLWRNLTDLEGMIFTIGFLGFIPLSWSYWPKHLWPWLLMLPIQAGLWLYYGNTMESRLLMLPVVLVLIPAAFIPKPPEPDPEYIKLIKKRTYQGVLV